MTFRKRVVGAVAIQSLGTVAAFGTILLIARLQGPAAQGKFAQVKAAADLLSAIGCFGLPQCFVYVINRLSVSRRRLMRFSVWYSSAFFLVSVAVTTLAATRLLPAALQGIPIRSMIIMSGASAGIVMQELWRGVYLTYDDGPGFSLITILQAVGLLGAVAAALLVFRSERYDVVYLGCAGLCVSVTWAAIRPKLRSGDHPSHARMPWGVLFKYGVHVFLQGLLAAMQPALTFWFIRHRGGTNQEVGWFNVGVYVYQAFAIPLQMVSPIFYNRWSKELSPDSVRAMVPALLKGTGIVFLLSLLVVMPLRYAVIGVFGQRYLQAVPICQVLVLAAAPLCLYRVLIPMIHCAGRPHLNTYIGLLRIGTLYAVLTFFAERVPVTAAATSAWAACEVLSALAASLLVWNLADREKKWTNAPT